MHTAVGLPVSLSAAQSQLHRVVTTTAGVITLPAANVEGLLDSEPGVFNYNVLLLRDLLTATLQQLELRTAEATTALLTKEQASHRSPNHHQPPHFTGGRCPPVGWLSSVHNHTTKPFVMDSMRLAQTVSDAPFPVLICTATPLGPEACQHLLRISLYSQGAWCVIIIPMSPSPAPHCMHGA